MNKNLKDILYNSGSINSCAVDCEVQEGFGLEAVAIHLTDKDYHLLGLLEDLIQENRVEGLEEKLLLFCKSLSDGMSVGLGSMILMEFNRILMRLTKLYPQSKHLYYECLQVIVEFKNQIDEQMHGHGMMNQKDWIELETSLYYLANWEDGLGWEDRLRVWG